MSAHTRGALKKVADSLTVNEREVAWERYVIFFRLAQKVADKYDPSASESDDKALLSPTND
jgi:hypothetical protein